MKEQTNIVIHDRLLISLVEMSNQTNKHTYKQYENIKGQIFYGGFSSETECSERKKKDEETNQLLEA